MKVVKLSRDSLPELQAQTFISTTIIWIHKVTLYNTGPANWDLQQ